MGATHLRPVGGSELPQYPEELCDARLSTDYFTMFWHDRFFASDMHMNAPLEVQGAALNLYFFSRKQTPVGSLPDSPRTLARMLRIDFDQWERLCREPIGPLHKWERYAYRDEVVLGHHVVIEVALDALAQREKRKASNADKAVYARLVRLAEDMRRLKCDERMCQDRVLLERLDGWLVENHHGQRRWPQFETSLRRALNHATQQGWIGRGGNVP
ncbi:hypothetical protein [Roseivivax isoporae]|uniref:Uncharacterized protein n=1 Tax=Roseivivax isoporae LMG 25204 TaxID=1449351 RepID=X7F2Y5_9RHOB|nr:hypothetical protein [Roseivivax isoporae]ETX26456.1 hypothetical protein RISW2_02520 [Roseivivax isoporae LMG 25204]